MAASYQSGSTIHDLTAQALKDLACPTPLDAQHLTRLLNQISLLVQYNLTATTDTADCLTRLNTEAVKKLRNVWLDSSRLPQDVKDGIKLAPIEPGSTPLERGIKFMAPVAGVSLKHHHDQACEHAKADKFLSRKAANLHKSAPQK